MHGGGSYGHKVVKNFRVKNKKEEIGPFLTIRAMRELGTRFLTSLLDYACPALPVQISSTLIKEDGDYIENYREIVKNSLKSDWIPLLNSDVIMSGEYFEVISGETILELLSEEFDVEKIIVFSDTEGVFKDYPENQKLVKEINDENFKEITESILKGNDATGEMLHKIKKLYEIKKKNKNIECTIASGKRENNVLNALRGELNKCTRIK